MFPVDEMVPVLGPGADAIRPYEGSKMCWVGVDRIHPEHGWGRFLRTSRLPHFTRGGYWKNTSSTGTIRHLRWMTNVQSRGGSHPPRARMVAVLADEKAAATHPGRILEEYIQYRYHPPLRRIINYFVGVDRVHLNTDGVDSCACEGCATCLGRILEEYIQYRYHPPQRIKPNIPYPIPILMDC
jgi:hypothetical protein